MPKTRFLAISFDNCASMPYHSLPDKEIDHLETRCAYCIMSFVSGVKECTLITVPLFFLSVSSSGSSLRTNYHPKLPLWRTNTHKTLTRASRSSFALFVPLHVPANHRCNWQTDDDRKPDNRPLQSYTNKKVSLPQNWSTKGQQDREDALVAYSPESFVRHSVQTTTFHRSRRRFIVFIAVCFMLLTGFVPSPIVFIRTLHCMPIATTGTDRLTVPVKTSIKFKGLRR